MSEKFTPRSEEAESNREQHEHTRQVHERELTAAEREHGEETHIDAHRAQVEQHAKAAHELKPQTHEKPAHHPVIINKHLKDVAFTRSMTRTRKKLSPPARALSKVIHAPGIERTSEIIGKTIARPSSMLGGSFIALLGTSLLLWVTRHYGYEYNYLAVILLFAIGFAVGIGVESLWRVFKKRS